MGNETNLPQSEIIAGNIIQISKEKPFQTDEINKQLEPLSQDYQAVADVARGLVAGSRDSTGTAFPPDSFLVFSTLTVAEKAGEALVLSRGEEAIDTDSNQVRRFSATMAEFIKAFKNKDGKFEDADRDVLSVLSLKISSCLPNGNSTKAGDFNEKIERWVKEIQAQSQTGPKNNHNLALQMYLQRYIK